MILSSNRHKSQIVTVLFRARLAIPDIFNRCITNKPSPNNVRTLTAISGSCLQYGIPTATDNGTATAARTPLPAGDAHPTH
jgi:hypothetical protein